MSAGKLPMHEEDGKAGGGLLSNASEDGDDIYKCKNILNLSASAA